MRELSLGGLVMALAVSAVVMGCSGPAVRSEKIGLRDPQPVRVVSVLPTAAPRVCFEESSLLSSVKKQPPTYLGPGDVAADLIVRGIAKGIDSVINGARKSDADELAAPLIRVDANRDFPEEFWMSLEPAVRSSAWLSPASFEKRSGDSPVESSDLEGSSALLVLTTDQCLSSDARQFLMKTTEAMYHPGARDPVFVRSLMYVSPPIGSQPGDAAVQAWLADDGSPYRREMDRAIADTMTMLQRDILSPRSPGDGRVVERAFEDPITQRRDALKGTYIDQGDDRAVFLTTESMLSVPAASLSRPD